MSSITVEEITKTGLTQGQQELATQINDILKSQDASSIKWQHISKKVNTNHFLSFFVCLFTFSHFCEPVFPSQHPIKHTHTHTHTHKKHKQKKTRDKDFNS